MSKGSDPKAAAAIREVLALGLSSGVVSDAEREQMEDAADRAEKQGLDSSAE